VTLIPPPTPSVAPDPPAPGVLPPAPPLASAPPTAPDPPPGPVPVEQATAGRKSRIQRVTSEMTNSSGRSAQQAASACCCGHGSDRETPAPAPARPCPLRELVGIRTHRAGTSDRTTCTPRASGSSICFHRPARGQGQYGNSWLRLQQRGTLVPWAAPGSSRTCGLLAIHPSCCSSRGSRQDSRSSERLRRTRTPAGTPLHADARFVLILEPSGSDASWRHLVAALVAIDPRGTNIGVAALREGLRGRTRLALLR
jgi:hypothetical protein